MFFLVDSPAHLGEYFPRVSSLRLSYDASRPIFDVVTAIELGAIDRGYVATGAGNGAVREVKERQAMMDHLCRLPVLNPGDLPVIPEDNRAAEVRCIRAG